jgi:hypothetical protein
MFDEIWVLIPLAPFLLGGLAIWTRHQSKMIEKQKELMLLGERLPESNESRQMREEMKYLKDRVAVLEQITTDGHSTRQLENEIEQLRDR